MISREGVVPKRGLEPRSPGGHWTLTPIRWIQRGSAEVAEWTGDPFSFFTLRRVRVLRRGTLSPPQSAELELSPAKSPTSARPLTSMDELEWRGQRVPDPTPIGVQRPCEEADKTRNVQRACRPPICQQDPSPEETAPWPHGHARATSLGGSGNPAIIRGPSCWVWVCSSVAPDSLHGRARLVSRMDTRDRWDEPRMTYENDADWKVWSCGYS